MAEQTIRAYISGKVQGVGFRAAVKTEAESRGITGYVKNLADGRVKVIASGDESGVEGLVMWLHKGPAQAKVENVEVGSVEGEKLEKFEIR
ncbi:MAG: acylphosphatase [Alteromonadaceae bacterium]|uniref:acylphosphatase n=1 Tax=unclassified Marinobacter TaxID=83889 RepID=UPI000C618B8E|nr:acylphosphatase [Marinobacter sp. BGYM27]MAA63242.1 acylphosphatase [Alteromonadaceae bacterium]MBH84232.1 acylphosphatase [Alteromonadaceae bacterium]MDG5498576.1 acylphosphatase [Marinobacter sp. BGYM27]